MINDINNTMNTNDNNYYYCYDYYYKQRLPR